MQKSKLSGKRLAGIDFGTKRIGIAVCDELHISVNPLTTITNDKSTYKDELKRIFESERIQAVVLGIPETFDGKVNTIIEKIKNFGTMINSTFDLEVYYIDESFTSKLAGGFMIDYGIKKKDRAKKGMIDKYAAVMILQQFLSELE